MKDYDGNVSDRYKPSSASTEYGSKHRLPFKVAFKVIELNHDSKEFEGLNFVMLYCMNMMNIRDLKEELKEMYREDQKDRQEKLYERDEALFLERDRLRLTRARGLLPYKDQLAPDSLCDLAMLFQHGEGPDDFKRALDLARLAVEKGYEDARWLAAAAEDRYLLSIGQEQIWGTQFRKSVAGTWEQQPLASDEDSGVTDDKRKEMNVPIRSEQLAIFKQKYGISEEDSGAII